eukprot:scaffold664_cov260-Pinguiococcus_pyrenoidosus.AAC.34
MRWDERNWRSEETEGDPSRTATQGEHAHSMIPLVGERRQLSASQPLFVVFQRLRIRRFKSIQHVVEELHRLAKPRLADHRESFGICGCPHQYLPFVADTDRLRDILYCAAQRQREIIVPCHAQTQPSPSRVPVSQEQRMLPLVERIGVIQLEENADLLAGKWKNGQRRLWNGMACGPYEPELR